MRISDWSSDVCSSDLIKGREIDKLGEVLDALVASGANQVNGPSFEIDQPEAVYDEARRAALEKAQQRARMYAKSLGMEVRRIVSISEGGGFQPPRPMLMAKASFDRAAESSPVSPGATTLTANLDDVVERGRGDAPASQAWLGTASIRG